MSLLDFNLGLVSRLAKRLRIWKSFRWVNGSLWAWICTNLSFEDDDEGTDDDADALLQQEDEDDNPVLPINLGLIHDLAAHEGDLDEARLPFRIWCFAHAFNLVSSTDAKKAETDREYRTVSRRFMGKAKRLWNEQ